VGISGIRRNIATVHPTEQKRFIDAVRVLNFERFYSDGVSYWDKFEDVHKEAHAAGQDVHRGPAFLPWHREICNRLEAALRDVDPTLSLHYWDWATDPRATSDGKKGIFNCFTEDFMGAASGDVGKPLEDFYTSESGENDNGKVHTVIWRNVNGGTPGPPNYVLDETIVKAGDHEPREFHFYHMHRTLQNMHNNAHNYLGGTVGGDAHFAFHDPFVFLLHSNVDRLWAKWQCAREHKWRLDPELVYGFEERSSFYRLEFRALVGGQSHDPVGPPRKPARPQELQTPIDCEAAYV